MHMNDVAHYCTLFSHLFYASFFFYTTFYFSFFFLLNQISSLFLCGRSNANVLHYVLKSTNFFIAIAFAALF